MTECGVASRLAENLTRVRGEIAAACARAGRDPRGVTLVAVSKYVDLPLIQALLAAGVTELGENRVQQLVRRAEALGPQPYRWQEPEDLAAGAVAGGQPSAPRWHMIGHLQRNKVKALLPWARILHSLDSERLAAEIQKVAEQLDVSVDAFIEVNVSGEASKEGVRPEELPRLVETVRAMARIRLRGLMTMAPFDPEPEHARPYFCRLRELLERLHDRGTAAAQCRHLSMGMSQDYTVAVEEGATFVRVGTVLYEGVLPPDHDDG